MPPHLLVIFVPACVAARSLVLTYIKYAPRRRSSRALAVAKLPAQLLFVIFVPACVAARSLVLTYIKYTLRRRSSRALAVAKLPAQFLFVIFVPAQPLNDISE
ncbi:MAG: hypothetical protein LBU41_00805 [Clostridiales Family XIII bacterium]|jgi:hypothetical protein|nr:hypothetical protein [Clostridiales Family XIII bacterium]